MKVSDFDYVLPPERVAQSPTDRREDARMLVHRLGTDSATHRRVSEIGEELRRGDLLVVNDTRVLPARLFAIRPTGGRVELLCTEPLADGSWRAMARPAKKLKPGDLLAIPGTDRGLIAVRRELDAQGVPGPDWIVRTHDGSALEDLLLEHGVMPLPPYIQRDARGEPEDRERYQTVFAERLGAVAAPTAGLHFSAALLDELEQRGIERASVTLHVGPGTFLPVTVDDTDAHRMHSERYELSQHTVDAILRTRARGGRVIAVGTTSVRVLEACTDDAGRLTPGSGTTRLFITPGYRFRAIDGLLTNFHLPQSTLLMLVSALAGRQRTLALYREAVEHEYRFYSYGDAMLLLPLK
jgi:S-adenosylmethionine:tRNA ribosyltransferase-isomerase